MITIQSFSTLPLARARKGKVYSIALTHPKNVGVCGVVGVFRPTWDIVNDYKARRITEEQYTAKYRELIVKRWPAVKSWLDSLGARDMYLCCWEKTGFCHRYLVAKLIAKFRPDIELRTT